MAALGVLELHQPQVEQELLVQLAVLVVLLLVVV
jgi:hypothetical protein